jgi:hypothetical protein
MSNQKTEPRFSVGEVAILQPPHPSARHLWGQETTVLSIHWNEDVEDAMGGYSSGWGYFTDIPAPPPTNLPEDQHDGWLWCEYDLKKKYDGGSDFKTLMAELKKGLIEV